jgi:hypothetical protein
MSEIIWLDDIPGSNYHADRCPCDGHCGNCWADLAQVRAVAARLAAQGAVGPAGPVVPLHPLARYCSPYCKGRAKRERALDRRLASAARPLT